MEEESDQSLLESIDTREAKLFTFQPGRTTMRRLQASSS